MCHKYLYFDTLLLKNNIEIWLVQLTSQTGKMEELLIAILIALKTLFPPDPGTSTADYEARKLETARYVLDNNLYRIEEGGIQIDPDVSQ